MERSRKIKLLSITALVIAIAGMTLGFAAFSKVLTITSSATVTPNEEDFKVVTYGFKDEKSFFEFVNNFELKEDYLSNEISIGVSWDDDTSTGTPAAITNNKNSTSISNIIATFDKNQSAFEYGFIIRNESNYDAYIDLEEFDNNVLFIQKYGGKCIPVEENSNQEAIDEACKNIQITIDGYTKDTENVLGTKEQPYYKLSAGEYIYLDIQILTGENTVILDTYTVNFEEITINFSTAP